MMGDLFHNKQFITREDAESMFELGTGQFLQYGNINQVAREIWPSTPDEPAETRVLQVILYMAEGRRFIMHLYRALQEDLTSTPLPVQSRWEVILGEPLSEKDWIKVHEGVKAANSNVRFKLVQYNFVHQAYLTPKTLSKIFPTRADSCPRCGAADSDFMHMVWTCPRLSQYWTSVLGKIQEATGLAVPKGLREVLLGLLPAPKEKKLSRQFVMLVLTFAKRQIAIS